jgi:transaldolase
MATNPNLDALAQNGVSVWLDDLSRSMISSGDLEKLLTDRGVVGVTTNPTIFAAALSKGEAYADQVAQLAGAGADVDAAVFAITTDDVRSACDVLRPVYDATGGQDGRVSIEVDPGWPATPPATIEMARSLWDHGRPAERADQDPGDQGGPAGDHRPRSPRASRST